MRRFRIGINTDAIDKKQPKACWCGQTEGASASFFRIAGGLILRRKRRCPNIYSIINEPTVINRREGFLLLVDGFVWSIQSSATMPSDIDMDGGFWYGEGLKTAPPKFGSAEKHRNL